MKQRVDYRCKICYKTKTEILDWGEGRCPDSVCDCGGKMTWFRISDYIELKSNRCYVDELMVDRPRYSDAMGINLDQEPEVRKRFPKLDLTFDNEGRLLVKNRVHKKQLMKAFGMTEFDGTSWRKSGAQVKVKPVSPV